MVFIKKDCGISLTQNKNFPTKGKLGAGMVILACLLVLNFQGSMAAENSSKGEKAKKEQPRQLKALEPASIPAGLAPSPSVKKPEPPLKKPLYFQVGQFIVNLKDEKQNRYLKIKVHFLMSEPNAVEYLSKRLAEVKDVTRGELENLRSEDLQQAEKREELRQRVKAKVSQLFPKKKENRKWKDPQPIKKVLFEELVVQ